MQASLKGLPSLHKKVAEWRHLLSHANAKEEVNLTKAFGSQQKISSLEQTLISSCMHPLLMLMWRTKPRTEHPRQTAGVRKLKQKPW